MTRRPEPDDVVPRLRVPLAAIHAVCVTSPEAEPAAERATRRPSRVRIGPPSHEACRMCPMAMRACVSIQTQAASICI